MKTWNGRHGVDHLLGGAAALLLIPFAADLAARGVRRAVEMQGLVPTADLLVTAAAVGLAAVAARLALVHLLTGACLLAARAGHSLRAGTVVLRVLAPRLARQVAVATAGAGLAAGALALPAVAGTPHEAPDAAGSPVVPTAEVFVHEDSLPSLSWDDDSEDPSPTVPEMSPTAPADSTATPVADPPPEPPAGSPPALDAAESGDPHGAAITVTVEPGDSLWSLTADLAANEDPRVIAALWPQLYEANRDTLTEDPDLIHPGAELTIPHHITAEESR